MLGKRGRYDAQLVQSMSGPMSGATIAPMPTGSPFSEQGFSNVYAKLRLAPLKRNAHLKGRQNHPIFLYQPHKNLTGMDQTYTVLGLADVNFGLHQRRLYEDFIENKTNDRDIPREIQQYKNWPLTVNEFLGAEKQIVLFGLWGDNPGDIRNELPIMTRPAHLYGLAHNVPWLWDTVTIGDRIGFRVGMVPPSHVFACDPDGNKMAPPTTRTILQVTPIVCKNGRTPLHSIGEDQDWENKLDGYSEVKVTSYERELVPDSNLPLGKEEADSAYTETYEKVYTPGFYLHLGMVHSMTGKAPSSDGRKRACRLYGAIDSLVTSHNTLDVILDPHSRFDPLL